MVTWKPGNILLVDGHVKVADFGTSQTVSATTRVTSANAVTFKYAAPEQFESTSDPLSDVYSLGLVMYEILSGKEAFEGYSTKQIFGAKFRDKPLPFDFSVPDCLKDLISRCLNSDPMLRPTISEIIEIIKSVNVSDCDDESSLINDGTLIARNQQLSEEVDSLKSLVSDLKKENDDLIHSSDQTIMDLTTQFRDEENSLKDTISFLKSENNSLKVKVHDLESKFEKSCHVSKGLPLLAPLVISDNDFNGLAGDTDYKSNRAIMEEVQRLQSGAIDLSEITGHKVSAILISKNKNIPDSNFKQLHDLFENSISYLLPLGEVLNSDSCQAFTTSSIEAAFISFNFPNNCFSKIHLNKSGLHLYYCLTCGHTQIVGNSGTSGVREHGNNPNVWTGPDQHRCPKCSNVNWSPMDCSSEVPFKHFSSNPQWQPGLQPVHYDVFTKGNLEPCLKGLFRYSNLRSWLLGSSVFLYMVLARACVTNGVGDQYARMYDVEHGLAQLRDTLIECLDVLAIVLRVTRPQVSLIIAHVIRKISSEIPSFVCATVEQKFEVEARIMAIFDSIELDPLPKSDVTAITRDGRTPTRFHSTRRNYRTPTRLHSNSSHL
ncbi:hypothetical protein GEMRC1_002064 [Eukaryota sp. GEM-RC1]